MRQQPSWNDYRYGSGGLLSYRPIKIPANLPSAQRDRYTLAGEVRGRCGGVVIPGDVKLSARFIIPQLIHIDLEPCATGVRHARPTILRHVVFCSVLGLKRPVVELFGTWVLGCCRRSHRSAPETERREDLDMFEAL